MKNTQNLAVIILAAGKGTRMKSDLPKVLHLVAGRPMLWHVVKAAQALGPEKVVIITGHGADEVESMVKAEFPAAPITFARQTEQKGTGHAVMQCAGDLAGFTGTTIILYGDAPLVSATTVGQLLQAHSRANAAVTVLSTHVEDPTGFGRIVRDDSGSLLKSVEEKNATEAERTITEVNTCIFACRNEDLWSLLNLVQPSPPKDEYYLTDILHLALQGGLPTQAVETPGGWQLLGVNDPAQLAAAESIYRNNQAA